MYRLEHREGATVVHVLGEIDFATRQPLREMLDPKRYGDGAAVIVTLEKCRYLDSTALGELMRAHKAWGQRLSVVLPKSGPVARIFAVSGVDRILYVKSSVAEALLQPAS